MIANLSQVPLAGSLIALAMQPIHLGLHLVEVCELKLSLNHDFPGQAIGGALAVTQKSTLSPSSAARGTSRGFLRRQILVARRTRTAYSAARRRPDPANDDHALHAILLVMAAIVVIRARLVERR